MYICIIFYFLGYDPIEPGETFSLGRHNFDDRFTEIDDCEPAWLYKCDPYYIMKPRCTLRTTAHFIIAGISFVGLVIVGASVYYTVKCAYTR